MTAADQFHKSADGGVTWELISTPMPSPATIATGPSGTVYAGKEGQICRSSDAWATSDCSDFPSTPSRIFEVPSGSAAPTEVRVLVASHVGVYASGDGGATWTPISGLTSLDYTLTVTDRVTGAVRTYESPGDFCGSAHADTFAD